MTTLRLPRYLGGDLPSYLDNLALQTEQQVDRAFGAFARSLAQSAGGIFNVRDYGAVGDGVTDDSPAIQACIDAAAAAHGEVYLPPSSGGYLINTCLNLCNKLGVSIRGAGGPSAISFDLVRDVYTAGSVLIGNTGTGHAVIEMVGAVNITLRDFTITTSTPAATNRSTRGILVGTSNAAYYPGSPGGCGMHWENVHVLLADPGGALNTAESIPIYGNSVNVSTLVNCTTSGNYGLVLVGGNPLGITPQYQGWGINIQSDGMHVSGCSFGGWGPSPPLYLSQCNISQFDQTYVWLLNGSPTYAGNPYALYVRECADLFLKLEQDYFPCLGVVSDVKNCRFWGTHFPGTTPVPAGGQPLLWLFTGRYVVDTEFKINCIGGVTAPPGTYHYTSSGAANPTLELFRNCDFAFDTTQAANVAYLNVVNAGGTPFFNLRFNGNADTTNTTWMWSAGGVSVATPLANIRSYWNGKAVGTA